MLVSCQMTIDFSAWLQNELATRDMTPADLARATGKDQGIFTRILKRERKPENETLRAIAKAFRIPAGIVFQAAGELPKEDSSDEWVEEMNYKMNLVPQSSRSVVEKIVNALIEEPQITPKTKKAKANA